MVRSGLQAFTLLLTSHNTNLLGHLNSLTLNMARACSLTLLHGQMTCLNSCMLINPFLSPPSTREEGGHPVGKGFWIGLSLLWTVWWSVLGVCWHEAGSTAVPRPCTCSLAQFSVQVHLQLCTIPRRPVFKPVPTIAVGTYLMKHLHAELFLDILPW